LVSTLAYFAGVLTFFGAIAATLMGGIILGYGGILPAVLLGIFFLSSSSLSRIGRRSKAEFAQTFEKEGRRDHIQVFANGGITALLALFLGISGNNLWLAGIAGALATVNADTWATEIGVLARHPPRLITSGSPVSPGTSGAVSLEGLIATLLGASLISGVAAFVGHDIVLAYSAAAAGFFGALFDSYLGASIQAMYFCPTCEMTTEHHPLHSCGTQTEHIRGWTWMTNDMVNFLSSILGAFLSGTIWKLLS
jgi:uncharacterized protein (TIGR00297 family)